MTEINEMERMHGDVQEHKHVGLEYWHPVSRMHAEITKDELPAGHVLSKKPLVETLFLDRVEVTPIQRMEIGASLEIGAIQSLMEGLEYHRYAASCLISDSFTLDECTTRALFYAEWEPNHSRKTHRYLVVVGGEKVYVGYFPWDGRKPRLYGVHHKKQDVVKFLHRTHSATLQLPELTLLTELNIPNIVFDLDSRHVTISHKQGVFYTRSIYGEFTPLSECKFIPDRDSGDTPETIKGHWDETVDATGYNMGDPKHPWYMFQGAIGYVQLYEGKMFCYPDGSIRFLTKEEEKSIFREYTDLQIVQGDLVAYEDVPLPERKLTSESWSTHHGSLDRHEVANPENFPYLHVKDRKIWVLDDCHLTITHPEHGECKYEAHKGDLLALLPGTSRPFQKEEGRD